MNEEKPKGYEKWRVRQHQKDRAKKRREEAAYNAEMRLRRKLAGRERGHTGIPQLILPETAGRWRREGRRPKNRISVIGV